MTELLVRERFLALDSTYTPAEKAMFEQEFQKYIRRIRDESRDEGRNEACNEARNEARSEARNEARRQVLVRLLERRFGPLDVSVLERIAAADDAHLDAYTDRVLDAASVAEVLGGGD